ncbi:MAG: hypothetical protein IPP29_18390 [Bacteroidetes bacterium]|nr:hypothetical protein [Bacteroidota bacterium]
MAILTLRDGIYTGKLVLTAVTGATFTNTVTFQSENADSTLVTITAASSISGLNNYTVQLSGADYFIFKQVTIERSGTSATSRVIDIGGGSDYNSFANCIITNGTIAGSNNLNALVHSAVGTTDNYNTFSNNSFINGSYGFYFFGGTTSLIENGNMIDNNLFVGQSAFAIQSGNQADFMANGNIITGNTATYNTAIYLANCNSNSMALENKIVLTDGGTGILVQQCNGGTGEVVVANNFVTINAIVNTTNSQVFGIKLISCSNTGIYFNNVLNTADFTAASLLCFSGNRRRN